MSSFTIPESILSLGGVVRWCFSGSPHQLEDLVAARFFTPTLVVIRFMLYSSYLPLHLPFLLQVLPEILVSDLLAFPRSSSQTFIQPHLLTHAPLLQSLASLDSCLSFYKPFNQKIQASNNSLSPLQQSLQLCTMASSLFRVTHQLPDNFCSLLN